MIGDAHMGDSGDRVRDQLLAFANPHVGEAEIEEVVDSLRSKWLTTGPKVARFEASFREYVGSRFARALNSCSAGLHLGLLVAGIGPGDEVITTPLTFVATVNAVLHVGATPVLVDVDRETQNIDPNRVAAAVSERTRAVLPVHMAGRPCDLAAIDEIARGHGLVVIDDAAHALGAEVGGRKIGSLTDLTSFSFYAGKNVTTGEGGMVTTDHEEWAEQIEMLALHGLTSGAWERHRTSPTHALAVAPGFKYNMMDLQAAIGIHQLPHVEEWRAARERIWQEYDRAFGDLPVHTPVAAAPDTIHARHLYTLALYLEHLDTDRDGVRARLYEQGIATSVHFTPVHLHPYHQSHLPYRPGDLPNAEWIGERTLSLPLTPFLSDDDVADVITAVHRVVAGSRH